MSFNREKWKELITAETHAGRYLFARKQSVYSECPTICSHKLANFLNKLDNAESNVSLLSSLYYFSQEGINNFIKIELKDMLKSLNRRTEGSLHKYRNQVKGRISWNKTLMKRVSQNDDNLYICKRNSITNNIPENMLLKTYLESTKFALDEILRLAGTGDSTREFTKYRHIIENSLKRQVIKDIDSQERASHLMISSARRSKNKLYSTLANIYIQLYNSIRRQKLNTIIELIQNNWFEPINDDDLFEIYVLICVLDILKDIYGEPEKYSLIHSGRNEIVKFTNSKEEILVYFDQSPETYFNSKYFYSSIVRKYRGITGKPRRPDIAIRIRTPQQADRILLLEVKHTSDIDYKNNSLYKAIAYLKDFEPIWLPAINQKPKIALVFSDKDIEPIDVASEEYDDIEIVSTYNLQRIKNIITSYCNQSVNK